MGFMDEKLWTCLENKAEEEDRGLRSDQQVKNEYLAAIKHICKFGIERANTIRDTFPMYTKHDETHICNVMRLMSSLLGERVDELSRDETAMLILSACCHDIGMSYSDDDKLKLLADQDSLNQYLDQHHSEYVKAYADGNDIPKMTDDMMQNYLRSIHHERVMDLLSNFEWPKVLNGKVNCEDLIQVCQSHGENITVLDDLELTPSIDLRFCAVILRLADILDFDTTRAPQTLYDYCGFENKSNSSVLRSKEEWDKHLSSNGFDFMHIADKTYPYLLPYTANSKSMQVEQAINIYLDWVDQEINNCGKIMRRFTGKWNDIVLPGKVNRTIKAEGYVSGQYRLTLDHSQIMELLIGNDLYSDPSVFVRELIQNAIDAVRTRQQLDKDLPRAWTPQIKIRTWMDSEGYHWFRIEDNGIGMTENTIENFFLKVGCSYYTSDTFTQQKIRCKADPDYTPISRFGIGILSCFMGDKRANQVEVSTKHFNENGVYYPALRLSMHGMNGYYYLASKAKNHLPGPMKGLTNEEKEQYRTQAGTVIAVRTNLYQTGKYRGFKEIVDHYVIYPQVAIHYDGDDGSLDYLTEADFMNAIHGIYPSEDLTKSGLIEFPLSADQLNIISSERPEISFSKPPKIQLKCIDLERYTDSSYLSGALLIVESKGEHNDINIQLGNRNVQVSINIDISTDKTDNILGLDISMVFPVDFKEEMHRIERTSNDYYYRDKLEEMERTYPDGYHKEIVRALSRRYFVESDWKKYMTERYNTSLKKLNEEIKKIETDAYQKFGVDMVTTENIKTWHDFNAMKTTWEFDLCRLSDFNWYMDYFYDTATRTSKKSVAAHNGVYCGSADFFLNAKYTKHNFGAILLLKDNYRPNVDVARDDIRQLTLETACDLAIIKRHIEKIGFNLERDINLLEDASYPYLPLKNYWTLLEKRPDLKERIIIPTEEGNFTLDQINTKLQTQPKLILSSKPELCNRSYWNHNTIAELYQYLCIAMLRKEFALRVQFKIFSTDICIFPKNTELQVDGDETIFPPSFFLVPLDSDYSCLARKDHNSRYACNANHRFSVWLQKNGMELKRYVPGIFKEMLKALAEENDINLINGINELLQHLHSLPNNSIKVPDSIFLKDNDLD